MVRFGILFLLIFSIEIMYGQDVTKIPSSDFKRLEPLLHYQNDTVYIINFWASWCVPCRKELPSFQKIESKYKNSKVKIILVSLDFPNQVKSNLIPFLNNNHIDMNVILLNDPNSNKWINRVDSTWSGAIPATLIYKRNNRQFYEKELDYEVLDQAITALINK